MWLIFKDFRVNVCINVKSVYTVDFLSVFILFRDLDVGLSVDVGSYLCNTKIFKNYRTKNTYVE